MSSQRPSARLRGIQLLLAALLIGVTVYGAVLAVDRLKVDAEPTVAEDPTTAVVTRRDLVDAASWSGVLGYADTTVLVHMADSGTITWLPESGSTVTQGGALYRVDDEPVVLLISDSPLWRTLDTASEGADVEALETTLVAMGFDPDETVTVDGDYTANTAAMVERFQEQSGQEITGELTLGTVAMYPDEIRIATHSVSLGDAVTLGSPVSQISSAARAVVFSVDAESRGLISIGDLVDVRLPDRSVVPATITSLLADNSGADYRATASVADDGDYRSDQLEVTVLAATTAFEEALTVAPSALVALEGNRYQVRVVTDNGYESVDVEVLGKADRFVVINGAGLADGTIVLAS
jgi:peptidoglycan hydrolase-like protein with peptidoglycan-binding domain